MAANSQHRCVFVGNIPYDATEEQLKQICEEVGPVVSFRLVIDRETGKPKGYGFCEYKDEETALSARRNLQGYEINGRQLRVDFAENDKGADRTREQGRGGPGLTSNVGGPAILGDSTLHQPVGLPLAATAASVIAASLSDVQTSSFSKQNGLQGHFGSGNDLLSHYLAKFSRNQLHEIMSELKVMATQNKELARQLLLSSPQLPKALFQAQIMLGLVTPQVLQMPNIWQSQGSLVQAPSHEGIQDQKSAIFPPHPGQIPLTNKLQHGLLPGVQEGQLSGLPQNTTVNNQPSSVPYHQLPLQPQFRQSQQTQAQVLPQTMAGQSGFPNIPSTRPFSALDSSATLKQQVQPPLLEHHRPVGASNLGYNTQSALPNGTSDLLFPRGPLSQPSLQHTPSNSVILPSAPERLTKLADSARNNSMYTNSFLGSSEQKVMSGDTSGSHPSKLARLEDGRALPTSMSQNTSTSGFGATHAFGSGSLPSHQMSGTEGIHQSEKQAPQLAPDVESALLQQVMSLTAEQLSSLPPEQRQLVIQLQQMHR